VVAWPLAARAQQPVLSVIGFLRSTPAKLFAHIVAAFRQGLKETGFVDLITRPLGRNTAQDVAFLAPPRHRAMSPERPLLGGKRK
jgi:hypothetical protein